MLLSDMLKLRRLESTDETAIKKALEGFPNSATFSFVAPRFNAADVPFVTFLSALHLAEIRKSLESDVVNETLFFGFASNGSIAGRIAIRHELNEALLKIGGHIGYGIVPSMRGQGYASEILALALPFCRSELRLDRVLLTCDDDNFASIRTIEKSGGVLENKLLEDGMRIAKRRYWIDL